MLDDAYHEHQELKEKYKQLHEITIKYQLTVEKMVKQLEELTEQHNSALNYIEFLKKINEASYKHNKTMHEAFDSIMEKYLDTMQKYLKATNSL